MNWTYFSRSLDSVSVESLKAGVIDDYAKDGGEELFTKIHWVLQSNSYRIFKDS